MSWNKACHLSLVLLHLSLYHLQCPFNHQLCQFLSTQFHFSLFYPLTPPVRQQCDQSCRKNYNQGHHNPGHHNHAQKKNNPCPTVLNRTGRKKKVKSLQEKPHEGTGKGRHHRSAPNAEKQEAATINNIMEIGTAPKVPTKLMNSGGLNLETSTKKSETL